MGENAEMKKLFDGTNVLQEKEIKVSTNKIQLKSEVPVPRGKPKSGRIWKSVKTKFSSIKKSGHRLSFEKKQELRHDLRHIKELSKAIKDRRKEDALQKQQRREQNAERRLVNERRAEIVQVIKNPSKLKRMKKKQMRAIQKRDLSEVKVV